MNRLEKIEKRRNKAREIRPHSKADQEYLKLILEALNDMIELIIEMKE